jgi:phospholipase/lecithinase/hemolysin
MAGLVNVDTGCCGSGNYNGVIPCVTGEIPCTNRNEYLFWDPYHPTEAVAYQIAQAFYSGPPSAINPINIQQLAALP